MMRCRHLSVGPSTVALISAFDLVACYTRLNCTCKGKTRQDGRRAGWPENFDEDSGYQRAETKFDEGRGAGRRFDEGREVRLTKGQDKARKKTQGFDES